MGFVFSSTIAGRYRQNKERVLLLKQSKLHTEVDGDWMKCMKTDPKRKKIIERKIRVNSKF